MTETNDRGYGYTCFWNVIPVTLLKDPLYTTELLTLIYVCRKNSVHFRTTCYGTSQLWHSQGLFSKTLQIIFLFFKGANYSSRFCQTFGNWKWNAKNENWESIFRRQTKDDFFLDPCIQASKISHFVWRFVFRQSDKLFQSLRNLRASGGAQGPNALSLDPHWSLPKTEQLQWILFAFDAQSEKKCASSATEQTCCHQSLCHHACAEQKFIIIVVVGCSDTPKLHGARDRSAQTLAFPEDTKEFLFSNILQV